MKYPHAEKLKEITALLREKDDFVITTHVNPDPDALGSEEALYLILEKLGKRGRIVNAGPVPRLYSFVDCRGVIEVYRPAIIIGKGGMGDRTAKACQAFSCVYGVLTGGAALLAARGIKAVTDVFWLDELGMPECLWVLHVEELGPMIVTIDSHGNNLTEYVNAQVSMRLKRILTEMSL